MGTPDPVSRCELREEDFESVRNLLIDTQRITPPGFNWETRRWDGARYHNPECRLSEEFLRDSALWKTASGVIVAAVHPDSPGEACIEIHPDFRSLETEIVGYACSNLCVEREDRSELSIEVRDYDSFRQAVLRGAGFVQGSATSVLRRLRLGRQPFVEPREVSGYLVRGPRRCDKEDCQRIADLLNAAFERSIHVGRDLEVFQAHAPSYREELDLVAEASDGSFAAYVGIAYDPANRQAVFEPVCTHPDHRRHGLAAALMALGLRRLRAIGVLDVIVGTGMAVPANRLYESVGFTEAYFAHSWRWSG